MTVGAEVRQTISTGAYTLSCYGTAAVWIVLNDGLYGNSYSWISNSANGFSNSSR